MRQVGNLAVLPIRTKIRGPAPLGMSFLVGLRIDDCDETTT